MSPVAAIPIGTRVSFADSTVIAVSPAASSLSITGPLSAGGVTLTKAARGVLTLDNLSAAEVMINAGTLALAPTSTSGGVKQLVTGTLTIAGGSTPTGTLDLANNSAIVDYPTAGPNPSATTRDQILSGRGGSGLGKPWNGQGITSSTVANDVLTSPNSTSIGYAVNGEMPLGAYPRSAVSRSMPARC